jgi:cell wall-associated NlpC family hydrolase
MAGNFWLSAAIAVGLAALLGGCAGAPPPPSTALRPPPALIGRNPQEVALEQALREFYGAPYRSGGTSPEGVDCSGLVQALFHQAGINLPRTVAQQYNAGRPVAPRDLRFGDVVFFDRYCQTQSPDFFMASIFPSFKAGEVCHDGLYLGEGRFIHASPRGVMVSRLDAETWRRSFKGARRFLP